jgi:hypothetical protein
MKDSKDVRIRIANGVLRRCICSHEKCEGSCMVVVRYNGWRCKVGVDRSVRSGLAKSRVLGWEVD